MGGVVGDYEELGKNTILPNLAKPAQCSPVDNSLRGDIAKCGEHGNVPVL